MNLPPVQDAGDLKGKVVLYRVDYNVPVGDDGKVDRSEAWRIEATLPTLDYLISKEAKVVVLSHIGRDPSMSLRPVVDYFNIELNKEVGFVPEPVGPRATKIIQNMGNGQVVVLENLRSDSREVENDIEFASLLALYGDLYVTDAFSVSHREHASLVTLPRLLPAYAGMLLLDEVEHLTQLLHVEKPMVMIIGGLKFKTKLPVVDKYLSEVSNVLLGGALAHPIYEKRGFEIGQSVIDREVDVSHLVSDERVLVPNYVVIERDLEVHDISVSLVGEDDMIVDLGYETVDEWADILKEAKTILWNGPVGYYEEGFEEGSIALMEVLEDCEGYKVVGGGDSVEVVMRNGHQDTFDFVSTAGGAMLEFLLVDGNLPGLSALVAEKIK